MKTRPVLKTAVALTILVELILMILVYLKVGTERFPGQVIRLGFQVIFILLVLINNSNKALFILTAYHFLTGVLGLDSENIDNPIAVAISIYHILIGIIIYLHDWLELRINKMINAE